MGPSRLNKQIDEFLENQSTVRPKLRQLMDSRKEALDAARQHTNRHVR